MNAGMKPQSGGCLTGVEKPPMELKWTSWE
jgi:hypothetical protein